MRTSCPRLTPVAPERLSHLQRCILTWLAAEEQRTRGSMAASYEDLRRSLAHDRGNLSHSLGNLEAKGLITTSRTLSRRAKAVHLTPAGRRVVVNKEKTL
jgi:DNA-binding MarR family transcriptional regulator